MTKRVNNFSSWSDLLLCETYNIAEDSYRTYDLVYSGFLHQTIQLKPDIVFLMIGFNDADKFVDTSVTYNYFEQVCNEIHSHHIPFVIQSVLPPTQEFDETFGNGVTANNVDQLNNWLISFADSNNYHFLDLRENLTTGKFLKDSYTSGDGVHLNYEGYVVWSQEVLKYVNK